MTNSTLSVNGNGVHRYGWTTDGAWSNTDPESSVPLDDGTALWARFDLA